MPRILLCKRAYEALDTQDRNNNGQHSEAPVDPQVQVTLPRQKTTLKIKFQNNSLMAFWEYPGHHSFPLKIYLCTSILRIFSDSYVDLTHKKMTALLESARTVMIWRAEIAILLLLADRNICGERFPRSHASNVASQVIAICS